MSSGVSSFVDSTLNLSLISYQPEPFITQTIQQIVNLKNLLAYKFKRIINNLA